MTRFFVRLLQAFMIVACAVSTAQAATFGDMQAQLNAGNWTAATAVATELDVGTGYDINKAYAHAFQLFKTDQCGDAVRLAEAVANAAPYMVPAHEIVVSCRIEMGDEAGAVTALNRLLAVLPEGPQRDVAAQVRNNILSRSEISVSLYGELVPSTNVERQTQASTYYGLPITSASQGHFGVTASGGATFTKNIISEQDFTLSALLRTDVEINSVEMRFRPEIEVSLPTTFKVGPATVVATPFVEMSFLELSRQSTRAGIRGVVSAPIDQATQIALQASVHGAWYDTTSYRDGVVFTGGVNLSHVLTSSTRTSVGVNVMHDHTFVARHQTTELSGTLRLDQIIDNSLVLALKATGGVRWHNAPPPLLVGPNQFDTFVSLRAEASHREVTIGPFMPTIFGEVTRQWSDNLFYDYVAADVGLGLKAAL